ncbi:hypothetical protein SRABI96_01608 [Peribacillus sp. Bi96]|uniref:hypothetical protein n=1 Tax=unclassified Peribacillus TaxID=2675266 RepID=UPI001D9D7EC8|nr:hypothetical protein [Peribacillus sp. Bi96]CAH0188297.1 hypothetical protein SRABI96_01608 [Peribacillus sp. Bi96]
MRIEAIIATIWIITTYTRTVFTTALGMIMIFLSIIIFPTVQVSGEFNNNIWLFFASTFGLIMPLLLLIIGKLKNTMNKRT